MTATTRALHSDTVAAMREWEQRFPVERWTVDGENVWPMIRIDLGAKLLAARRPGRPRWAPWATPARETVESLFAAARDSRSNARSTERSDVLFLSRASNRQLVGDLWHDTVFDPIADILERHSMTTLALEYHQSGSRYRVPRRRPSALIKPALLRCQARGGLGGLGWRGVTLEDYREFTHSVRRRAPSVRPLDPSTIALRSRALWAVADYFGGILDEVEPRLVLCSCYYNLVGMAFCLAARRRGITSVDIQHGATLKNPAYEGWSRFPAEGYGTLPDHFWCWSDADAKPVSDWAVPQHRAMVGGHPWLAFWGEDRPDHEPYARKLRAARGRELNVLVSLTWSSGLSENLKQLLRQSPRYWTWWLRLHPLMSTEREEIRRWCLENAVAQVHIDVPTDLPLPLVLREADAHLTHNSTVVQEATALGCPTVLIDEASLDVYRSELDSGWARFADDPASIYAALVAQKRAARSLPRPNRHPSTDDVEASLLSLLDPVSTRKVG